MAAASSLMLSNHRTNLRSTANGSVWKRAPKWASEAKKIFFPLFAI